MAPTTDAIAPPAAMKAEPYPAVVTYSITATFDFELRATPDFVVDLDALRETVETPNGLLTTLGTLASARVPIAISVGDLQAHKEIR